MTCMMSGVWIWSRGLFCTRMVSGTSLLRGTPRNWPDIFGDCVNSCRELNVFGVGITGVFVLQMCVCVCACVCVCVCVHIRMWVIGRRRGTDDPCVL
jgi:hypothetical protein